MIFKIKYYLERKQREQQEQKKLLRKQLNLLAEASEHSIEMELAALSEKMCKVYKLLNSPSRRTIFIVWFSAMNFYLIICLFVFIKKLFRGKS